jgi:hypothetical protein
MKAVPHILNLSSNKAVSSMPQYQFDRRQGGPHKWSGQSGEEKVSCLSQESNYDSLVIQPISKSLQLCYASPSLMKTDIYKFRNVQLSTLEPCIQKNFQTWLMSEHQYIYRWTLSLPRGGFVIDSNTQFSVHCSASHTS